MKKKNSLKFEPSSEAESKFKNKTGQIDFGEPRDWIPNFSAGIALFFTVINIGTASGLILNNIAGEVYSMYLVLGLFVLVLMSIPMAIIFSVGGGLRYLRSYRRDKSVVDLFWLIVSALCFFSAFVVLTKGLSALGGFY